MERTEILKSERRALLQRIDRDELEAMDQLVEITALVMTLILAAVVYIASTQELPFLAPIAESINLVITFTIYVAYKIARIRLALDLRLWIISEVMTLAVFIIMVNLLLMIPALLLFLFDYVANLGYYLLGFLGVLGFGVGLWGFFMARILGISPSSDTRITFGEDYATKRWENLIAHDDSDWLYPQQGRIHALYLVQNAKLGYPGYTLTFFALVLMGLYQRVGVLGSLENLIVVICFGLVLVYSIFKLKIAQNEELQRLDR